MSFNTRNTKVKILYSFMAVLILLLQVINFQEPEEYVNHKLPEWNVERQVALISINSNQPSQSTFRQISTLNLSPANSFYDRYDIVSIPELTDSKKIYEGGFSFSHRYRTFL